jgi:hypothetical protein
VGGLLAWIHFPECRRGESVKGGFGQPGRMVTMSCGLVQVRDLLAGQGWFDLHQYRLGPDGGTLMHWSRIPDIPIIVLTGLFDLFLPQDMALAWAISVWPPISMLIVLGGLLAGCPEHR